jgi:hypothetical protein
MHALKRCREITRSPYAMFWNGDGNDRFYAIVELPTFWEQETQKCFIDRVML